MKILIQNGRVIDPASGLDQICDIAIAAGRIVGVNRVPPDFAPKRVVDGKQSVILPQVTFGIAVRMAVMSIVAGTEA